MVSQQAIDALNKVQTASYQAFGHPLPNYSVQEFIASKRKNLSALESDSAFAENLSLEVKNQGVDPSTVPVAIAALRAFFNQASDEDYAAVAREYVDAPNQHISPRDWWILKRTLRLIGDVSATFPHFGLDDLLRRCLPGTLLTGALNALVVPVTPTNEFLILFDPTTFDYVSGICESLAMLMQIREQILREKGPEYFGDHPFGGPILAPLLCADAYEQKRAEALRITAMALDFFVCRGKQMPFVLDLTPEWSAVVDLLRQMSICFMMAHEIGHLLLHVNDQSTASDDWKAWSRVMPLEVKEFQADAIAADIAAAVAKCLACVDNRLFAGADVFFLCEMLREAAVFTLNSGEPGGICRELEKNVGRPYHVVFDYSPRARTHPPTAIRYLSFLAWRKSHCPSWQAMDETSDELITLTDFMWKAAASRFLDLHGQGVRPARVWMPVDAV